jgi:hypothetical protein
MKKGHRPRFYDKAYDKTEVRKPKTRCDGIRLLIEEETTVPAATVKRDLNKIQWSRLVNSCLKYKRSHMLS